MDGVRCARYFLRLQHCEKYLKNCAIRGSVRSIFFFFTFSYAYFLLKSVYLNTGTYLQHICCMPCSVAWLNMTIISNIIYINLAIHFFIRKYNLHIHCQYMTYNRIITEKCEVSWKKSTVFASSVSLSLPFYGWLNSYFNYLKYYYTIHVFHPTNMIYIPSVIYKATINLLQNCFIHK